MIQIIGSKNIDYLYSKGLCSAWLVKKMESCGIKTISDLKYALNTKEKSTIVFMLQISSSTYYKLKGIIGRFRIVDDIVAEETGDLQESYVPNPSNVIIREIASIRLINVLSSINVHTLEDLILYIQDYGMTSLFDLRNFGKTSYGEVISILAMNGFSNDRVYTYRAQSKEETVNISFDSIPLDTDDFIYLPNIQLAHLGSYCSEIRELASKNINTTVDLYLFCKKMGIVDLYRIGGFKMECIQKIMHLLRIIQNRSLWNELYNLLDSNGQINWICVSRSNLNLFDNVKDTQIQNVAEFIQQSYQSQLKSLSIRSHNVLLAEMPYFGDFIAYLSLYNENYKSFKNCGKKTWAEIELFSLSFRKRLKKIIDNSDVEERSFIASFYEDHGYLPMFYMLAKHITKSDSRFEKLYRSIHGILCNPTDIKIIAEDYNLSNARVRQIIKNGEGFGATELTDISKYSPYDMLSRLYISKDEGLYMQVIRSENLPELSFYAFGYLVNLIIPAKHYQVRDNHYFFTQELLDCFDIKSALNDIEHTLTKKVSKIVHIPITVFMNSNWWRVPGFDRNIVTKILREIISDNYDVDIDEDDNVILSQNCIDVSNELYEIIKANEAPLSIDEIFATFKAKYPTHKYNNPSQIRSYLLKDNRICSIGKTSNYALVKWDVYTGTIRDLLYETLENSNDPLTIEELLPYICCKYNTNAKSLKATILSDKTGRFVYFDTGHVGISSKMHTESYIGIAQESNNCRKRIERKSFEERLKEYEFFLQTHHHQPLFTGTDEERVLYRWYNNVVNKCVTITPEREAEFNAMVQRNEAYMINGTEYAFYRRCDDYKVYLDDNMELPTMDTEPSLYRWFHSHYKSYMSFEDKRKSYFEDLISYIESYGFVIHN